MSKKIDTEFSSDLSSYFSGKPAYKRCHHKHPVLKLGNGTLVGGACAEPRDGCDIYVGLDGYMRPSAGSYPWEESKVIDVHYEIRDMEAPRNAVSFKKMITWLCTQLQAGKAIHVGCIGGHGRTGTVIAAIAAELLGEKDAISWARKHHCHKAVESTEQVNFLVKHYGVTKVDGAKERRGHHGGLALGSGSFFTPETKKPQAPGTKTYTPAPSRKSMWRTVA